MQLVCRVHRWWHWRVQPGSFVSVWLGHMAGKCF